LSFPRIGQYLKIVVDNCLNTDTFLHSWAYTIKRRFRSPRGYSRGEAGEGGEFYNPPSDRKNKKANTTNAPLPLIQQFTKLHHHHHQHIAQFVTIWIIYRRNIRTYPIVTF
jgi:hypothetical protein